MTALSYAAKGTRLQMGDGATPEVFTDLANLGDVDGPNSKLETLDVTHHGSAAKEYAATIVDGGEVKFSGNYDPADTTHKAAIAAHKAGTLKNFKLNFPAAVAAGPTFSAFITDIQTKAPVSGKLSIEVTLKISGLVVWPA